MILERSSTRVHHAPGGKSSICFGSDDVQKPARAAPVPGFSSVNAAPTTSNATTQPQYVPLPGNNYYYYYYYNLY